MTKRLIKDINTIYYFKLLKYVLMRIVKCSINKSDIKIGKHDFHFVNETYSTILFCEQIFHNRKIIYIALK